MQAPSLAAHALVVRPNLLSGLPQQPWHPQSQLRDGPAVLPLYPSLPQEGPIPRLNLAHSPCRRRFAFAWISHIHYRQSLPPSPPPIAPAASCPEPACSTQFDHARYLPNPPLPPPTTDDTSPRSISHCPSIFRLELAFLSCMPYRPHPNQPALSPARRRHRRSFPPVARYDE